jgi:hypothetical protein
VLSREGRRYIYMLRALTGPLLVRKPCYGSVSPWGVAPESVTRFLPGTGRGSQVTSVTGRFLYALCLQTLELHLNMIEALYHGPEFRGQVNCQNRTGGNSYSSFGRS